MKEINIEDLEKEDKYLSQGWVTVLFLYKIR